jgi:adenosine 3'-phospho 5'-phosphosulfate transporter B2
MTSPLARLGGNFATYTVLFAVLGLAFRHAKKLIRDGDRSWRGRLAWFCVVGGTWGGDADEGDAAALVPEKRAASARHPVSSAASRPVTSSDGSSPLLLCFCALGLQLSYLSWGVLQERLMTRGYGPAGEPFQSSQFIVFCNRVLALIVGLCAVSSGPCGHEKRMPHRAPFFAYSFASVSNIMSSWCQYEALKHVSFPAQVLSKSSKIIPVMLMGRLINRKIHPWYDYVVAVAVSAGAALFMVTEKAPKRPGSAERSTQATGVALLVCYLVLDGFTSQWQQRIFRRHRASPYQMMVGINAFSAVFTLAALARSGELRAALAFVRAWPECASHVALISAAGCLGQTFIFLTIERFGPLVFTIIMTTRQLLSILLSGWVYGHSTGPWGLAGAGTVFGALGFRVWKKREAQRRKAAASL